MTLGLWQAPPVGSLVSTSEHDAGADPLPVPPPVNWMTHDNFWNIVDPACP